MKIEIVAFALAIGVPVAAQEVVHATALPRATMSEMAAVPLRDPEPRVIRHRLLPPLRPGVRPAATLPVEAPAAATIAAPRVTTLFDADASRALVPADASGAVGPAHVLTTNNARVIVHDRAGKLLKSVSQDQFWASGLPAGEYYDPRAEYDPATNRWFLMAINDEMAIAFAASETGDPTGAWRRYLLVEPGVDFSMMAVTRDTVVFGTMGYDADSSLLVSVRKQDLLSGQASIPTTRHRFGNAFAYPVTSSGGQQYVVMPDGHTLVIRDLNRPSWSTTVNEPPQWHIAPFGNLPQLGGHFLDAGYGFLEDVAERDGWIYATMIRAGPQWPTQAVTWARIRAESGEAQWGAISDPAGKTTYAYPSLAVNRQGGMLIAFGTFSPASFASSAFFYRDFLGRVSDVTPIRAGTTAVTVHDRWGDYTTTVVDPVDDTSFWTTQIHATNSSWGTTWGKIEAATGTPKRRAARH